MSNATLPKIVMGHDELIEALEARRPWAQKIDAKALKKHEADERRYLTAWQKACREATRWDYETLRANHFSLDFDGRRDRPHCPSSVEQLLDTILKSLRLDKRKSVTLSDDNENKRVYWLLTHDENAKADMC